MAQMPATLVIKKNDGTTDITWTGVSPASGEAPCVLRSLTVGTATEHNPEFRLSAKDSKGGKSRHLRSTFVYPQIATNTTTGVTSVVNRAMASTDWDLPKGMPATDVAEFVSQYANLLYAAIMKQTVKEGFSLT